MSSRKGIFFALVVLFSVISIVDVSLEEVLHPPTIVKHSAHLLALAVIGSLGYWYWNSGTIRQIWLIAYVVVAAAVAVNYIFFLITDKGSFLEWKHIVAQLRAVFGGPLPLLVFSLFQRLLRQ